MIEEIKNDNYRFVIGKESCKLTPRIINSDKGNQITIWRKEMPRIPDYFLDTVIYLYPSVDDARQGLAFGGTGFLISCRFNNNGNLHHLYAVTNSHVIREGKSTFIRLNTHDNNTDVIPTTIDDWVHHPDGDDVAMCYLGQINEHIFKYNALSINTFIKKGRIRSLQYRCR